MLSSSAKLGLIGDTVTARVTQGAGVELLVNAPGELSFAVDLADASFTET